ncbi:MAG: hypothetical protein KGJ86_17005 [Chloroflexota bacterium]|nr:hypothetical protein [Chloroflexota bacterium]
MAAVTARVLEAAKVQICAVASHMANRAYCLAIGEEQPPWETAPDWQRDSAVVGVRGVLEGNNPERSHECWMAEKIAAGWAYAPVKDLDAKTHPCLVPYDQLPAEQRLKDTIFVTTVRSMARTLGLHFVEDGCEAAAVEARS